MKKDETVQSAKEPMKLNKQQPTKSQPLLDMLSNLTSGGNPFDLFQDIQNPLTIGISALSVPMKQTQQTQKSTANIEVVEDEDIDEEKVDNDIQEDLDELLKEG
jgi:hypothetical protein